MSPDQLCSSQWFFSLPGVLALLSIGYLFSRVSSPFASKQDRREQDHNVNEFDGVERELGVIARSGGIGRFLWKVARVLGCAALVGLTVPSVLDALTTESTALERCTAESLLMSNVSLSELESCHTQTLNPRPGPSSFPFCLLPHQIGVGQVVTAPSFSSLNWHSTLIAMCGHLQPSRRSRWMPRKVGCSGRRLLLCSSRLWSFPYAFPASTGQWIPRYRVSCPLHCEMRHQLTWAI